jgi:hypothetical protein
VEVRKETGRGKGRFKIWDLLADWRYSQVVLRFRTTTDVRRLVPVEEEMQSEVSEWELRERREREEERRREAGELGVRNEEQLLFLPTLSFMGSAEEE